MPIKTYQLYCDMCHWKRITDGSNIKDLKEIKNSALQKTLPTLDKETQKLNPGKTIKQPKKFRCPQCGRHVLPRQIDNPQSKIDEQHKVEERMKRRREQEDRIDADKKSSQ